MNMLAAWLIRIHRISVISGLMRCIRGFWGACLSDYFRNSFRSFPYVSMGRSRSVTLGSQNCYVEYHSSRHVGSLQARYSNAWCGPNGLRGSFEYPCTSGDAYLTDVAWLDDWSCLRGVRESIIEWRCALDRDVWNCSLQNCITAFQ